MVHELADELDGGLGPVLLALRHVEVVDEDDELAADGGPVDPLPPTVELGEDQVLGLVGGGLR